LSGLDLAKYFGLFDDALEERYKDKFRPGRARIEALYLEVRSGRDITIDDVLAIFENDLPYPQDWTRPERNDLAMCSHHLASLLFVTAPTLPEFYVDYCKEGGHKPSRNIFVSYSTENEDSCPFALERSSLAPQSRTLCLNQLSRQSLFAARCSKRWPTVV
jgi:hypothetical protein